YVLMPPRADALLLGVLLAWAWHAERFREFVRETGAWILLPAAVCAVAVGVLARGSGDELAPGMAHGGYSWLALGYAFLVLGAAAHLPALRILPWRPLQALGRISYTIYLLHVAVLRMTHFATRGDFPSVIGGRAQAVTLLAFALTVGLAALSWWLLERPIL